LRGVERAAAGGQHDLYLRFLETVLENHLAAPGGVLAMVLPDPILIRGNAAEIRRRLFVGWETMSLLHLASAFPEAGVANAVPVWRNRPAEAADFPVCRIERGTDPRSLALRIRPFAPQKGNGKSLRQPLP